MRPRHFLSALLVGLLVGSILAPVAVAHDTAGAEPLGPRQAVRALGDLGQPVAKPRAPAGLDSGTGGWTHGGTLDEWEWGQPSYNGGNGEPQACAPGSEGGCWVTDLDGVYESGSDQELLSVILTIPVTATEPISVTWMQAWYVEDAQYDTAEAYYSCDGMPWMLMWQHGPTEYMPWQSVPGGPYTTNCVPGDALQLRFLVTSNETANYAGYYIDDVVVYDDLMVTIYEEDFEPPPRPSFVESAKAAPSKAQVGGMISYTIVVSNSGLLTGTTTIMTDVLPAGTTYVPGSLSCSVGTCWQDGTAVHWAGEVNPAQPAGATGSSYAPPVFSKARPLLDAAVMAASPRSEPVAAAPARGPDSVLWDQVANWDGEYYAAQDFEADYDTYDTYAGDDFENLEPWLVDTFRTQGGWDPAVDLSSATAIHWFLYGDAGGEPAGVPGDGNEFWSISLPPGDPQVGLGVGQPQEVVLSLDTPVSLPPGTWWLVHFASLEYSLYGQWGWAGSGDPVWGREGLLSNPGGGLGLPLGWTPNANSHDYLFRLGGRVDNNPATIEFALETPGVYCGDIVLNSAVITDPMALDWVVVEAATTMVGQYYYQEDFEAGDGGYVNIGTSTWLWGPPPVGPAHSGANAWGTASPYEPSADYQLLSPVIDLTGADPALELTLQWWQDISIEASIADLAYVEITTDTVSYDILWQTPAESPYDSQGWESKVTDISAYAGEMVQLRFRMDSDELLEYDGWSVDDVLIHAGCTGPGISIDPPHLHSIQCSEVQATLELSVCNSGDQPMAWSLREVTPTISPPALGSGEPARLGPTRANATPVDPGSVSDADAIADGSFEAGTPNPFWNEASLSFGTPICDVLSCGTGTGTGPLTGDFWAWLGGIAAYEEGSVDQDVVIPAGEPYLSFWLEQMACDGPADYMEVLVDGQQVFYTNGAGPLCGLLGYSLQVVDISAYADGGVHNLAFHAEVFGNSGSVSNFFVDDVFLGLPWLSEIPDSGAVLPGECMTVEVTLDSDNLAPGDYAAGLAFASNDLDQPEIIVPAGLTVLDCAAIEVEPDALESTQGPGAMADLTLVISNVGVSNLNWSFSEAAAPLSLPQHGPPVVGATAGGHAYGDADLPPLVETGIAVPAAPPRCAAGNGLLFYGDRGSFESDWPGLPVEGFEATLVPSNSLAICAGPFDSTTDNACFAPGGILDGIRFQVAPTPTRELAVFTENFVGAPSVLVGPNHSGDDHEILLLDGGVGAAGFDLYMLFGQDTCEVEIFGPGDALLGQAMLSVPGGVPGAFWGVASFDQPITRIGIRSLAEGGELLDDVAFGGVPLECGAAWASTDPINGTTAPGGGSEVTVTFDSTGYAAGVYTGMLCIESNDAVEPLVAVPLTMTVMEAATIVDITWLADGCQVTFDSTVSGVPPIAYSWDFGDGVGASTAEDPVYTYTAPGGSFSVTLDVDNQWGGSREVLGVSATCRPPFFYIYLPIVARD